MYPLSQKVAGERAGGERRRATLAAARSTVGARHGDGKGAGGCELQKFYSDVLPPDLSAARRITLPAIEQLASSANVIYDGRVELESRRSETAQLGEVHDDADAVGRLRQHPALHS